jgi:hypothetical protein
MSNHCKSCRAEVVWALLAKSGAKIPLDAGVFPDGNIIIRDGKAHVLGPDALAALPPNTPRFRSHFVTCPNAAQHRKERARG